MTKENINNYYKFFSYVSIALGILFLFISDEGLGTRIIVAIVINIVYHLFYYFPRILKIHKPFQNIARVKAGKITLKIFTIFNVFWALTLAIYIMISVANNNSYEGIFILTLPIGFFLGSYSVWLSLIKKQ